MLEKSLLLFLIGGLNISIGLLVLVSDYRKLQNRLFFLFNLALGGWVVGIGGFLMTEDPQTAFFWAKVYYSFPLLVAASMPLFSWSFPFNSKVPTSLWVTILAGYLGLQIPLLFGHTFVTQSLLYHEWGKEIVLNKFHYALYSLYLLGSFGVGLTHSFYQVKKARGQAQAQIGFYFYGFILTSFFGVLFNLIYPWFGNYRLIWLGPIFTSALVGTVAYGMIRHRMFDIRLVVTRSIGYLLTLTVVASLFGFAVFGLMQFIFGLSFPFKVQVAISIATGMAALAFQRLKRFFDRATNRLFYRDSYESEVFFDEINRVLVSTIDLDTLLSRTVRTITTYLKGQYCAIGIYDGQSKGWSFGTAGKSTFHHEIINESRHLLSRIKQSVVVADDLPKELGEFRQFLIQHDVAVFARFGSNYRDNPGQDLGYIILGPKKSGNPFTNQDIKVLETVANELIIAIQNALRFEEIQKFNETLQAKVEEATADLRRANDKLKKLDETKDDFISMASHQLRTPLTSVKGYVSMVLDGDGGKLSEMQRKLLNQSFVSAQRMVYLISDLLNVSRLKTGKFVIEAAPSDLSAVIEEEISQLQETAKSRNLELIYHKPQHFPTLLLDENKLRQVIMNFVDNAIYYTPNGGKIEITLNDNVDNVEMTVKDNGIGVPKHDQHNLFSKFYRAHNAKRARPDGTGLGLYMAKKVIVAQGGSVIFHSIEGKGSTFGFYFPKKHLLPPETAAKSAQKE